MRKNSISIQDFIRLFTFFSAKACIENVFSPMENFSLCQHIVSVDIFMKPHGNLLTSLKIFAAYKASKQTKNTKQNITQS